jgi:hypothetical protein
MDQNEKEIMEQMKEAARVKAEMLKMEENKTGFTREHNPDLKKNVYEGWKSGRTLDGLKTEFPDAKPQTIAAWISSWKSGKNLPK